MLDNEGMLPRNLDRPPLKDTVDIPSGGYTIIRFNADNPGIWMFHCHIEFHLEMGMSFFIKVGKDEDLNKKTENWQNCFQLDSSENKLNPKFIIFLIVQLVIHVGNTK